MYLAKDLFNSKENDNVMFMDTLFRSPGEHTDLFAHLNVKIGTWLVSRLI